MQVPFHPLIAHFPLTLAFILPVLIVIFAFMIKINKMTPRGWLIIVGLQLVTTITGYVALESGEIEEELVQKVVPKEYIHEHENTAEIFVGSTVIALVVSIAAFFLRKELQFYVKLCVALLSLVSCFFGYKTGKLGGELVYKHGAAGVYFDENHTDAGLLPSGGITDPGPEPVNESLKADETDYGEEVEHVDEDASRQED